MLRFVACQRILFSTRTSWLARRSRFNFGTQFAAPLPILGIDLGTTRSCVALADSESLFTRTVENADGERTIPSIVTYLPDGAILVGSAAAKQVTSYPRSSILASKRLLGQPFSKLDKKFLSLLPYKVVSGENDQTLIELPNQKIVTPTEVAAQILTQLRKTAEAKLKKPIQSAVITVPAYFNVHQRNAVVEAAKIAGIEVTRLLNEPTAAAISNGFHGNDPSLRNKRVVVYDFGGGTFDLSLLSTGGGGDFEVRASAGDAALGGVDFDNVLIDRILHACKGFDPREDPAAMSRIYEAAEKAKCELSTSTETLIDLPYLTPDRRSVQVTVTREEFESASYPLIERTLESCRSLLTTARMNTRDITDVLLVGGMTRMPKILESVRSFFRREPYRSQAPEEAVACGAALIAALQRRAAAGGGGHNLAVLERTQYSVGVEVRGGQFAPLIEKDTPLPTTATRTVTTHMDAQRLVNFFVYQGEDPVAERNTLLGVFDLDNVPAAPRGVPAVDVELSLDASGLLRARATELSSGVSRQMQMSLVKGPSDEQLLRQLRDREDARRRVAERAQLMKLIDEARLLVSYVDENLRTVRDRLLPEEAFGFREDVDQMRSRLEAAAQPDSQLSAADVAALMHQLRSKFRRTLTRLRNQAPPPSPSSSADESAERKA